jgi:hypothetical protein
MSAELVMGRWPSSRQWYGVLLLSSDGFVWILMMVFAVGTIACDVSPHDMVDGSVHDAGVLYDACVPSDGAVIDAELPLPVTPEMLLPLAPGNFWTYAVTVIEGHEPMCDLGNRAARVASVSVMSDRISHLYEHWCTGSMYLSYADDGSVDVLSSSEWYSFLAVPVAVGSVFKYASTSMSLRWDWIGRITVLAGTFSGCWSVSVVDGENVQTYCPGVGMVLSYAPSAGVRAELTAYGVQ